MNKIKSGNIMLWAAAIIVLVIVISFIVMFSGAAGDSTVSALPANENVTVSDIEESDNAGSYPDRLAEYSTSYNDANTGRSNNIEAAARYIDGTVLQPGDTFSFNSAVGERIEERGFSKATVYAFEETDEDFGGGISQTATTLFNAAVTAGMEITEHHPHMYTVNYTLYDGVQSYGNDTVVSWGQSDFCFINSSEHPVMIRMICKNGEITAHIYGTDDGKRTELEFSEQEYIAYGTVYRRPEISKTNQSGQPGRTVVVTRVVLQNGSELSREEFYVAEYRPLLQIVYTDALPEGCEYDVVIG